MATQYVPEEYPPLLREFAGYKLVIQGRSPRTVNEYMLDLRTFFRFLILQKTGTYRRPAVRSLSLLTYGASTLIFCAG